MESDTYCPNTSVCANNWPNLSYENVDVDRGLDLFYERINVFAGRVENTDLLNPTCVLFDDRNEGVEGLTPSSLLACRFDYSVANLNQWLDLEH